MTMSRGVVEGLWPRRAKNGTQYLSVQIEGDRYVVWDARLFELLEPGSTVYYEWKDRNGYPVITSVRRVEESETAHQRSKASWDDDIGSLSPEELRRIHCLKLGIEMYSVAGPFETGQEPMDAVTSYALAFERYVRGETPLQKLSGGEQEEARERLRKIDM